MSHRDSTFPVRALKDASEYPVSALEAVLRPLKSIAAPPNAPLFILIDSLDEALTVSTGGGGGRTSAGSGGGTKAHTITDFICNELVIGALPV